MKKLLVLLMMLPLFGMSNISVGRLVEDAINEEMMVKYIGDTLYPVTIIEDCIITEVCKGDCVVYRITYCKGDCNVYITIEVRGTTISSITHTRG